MRICTGVFSVEHDIVRNLGEANLEAFLETSV
jgi:hypothetical protein